MPAGTNRRKVLTIVLGTLLLVLFFYQKKGTAKVGRIFGPVMVIWFLVIGFLCVVSY